MPLKKRLAVIPVALLLAGCGSGVAGLPSPTPAAPTTVDAGSLLPSPSASPSPSPSHVASVSPSPGGPPYGVLVDLLTSPSFYLANVVGLNGNVWASLKLAKRKPIATQTGHAIDLPYVSTSSTALYALDGGSTVLALHLPDGRQTAATHLPANPGTEATFAVSPDDQQIAVSVLDFNRTPVHITLYTESLAGANHQVIFESDSNYVWPVAWHAGLLVLAHAYGPYVEDIVKAAPGEDNPYYAVSYHLVDPSTANRVYLLGACTVSGPLSPAGSGCIQGGTIDWRGSVSPPWSTHDWGSISSAAALSPDGRLVAAAEPDNPSWLAIWRQDGTIAIRMDTPDQRDWVGWLDDDHILIGSALHRDWQTRVVAVSTGKAHAVTVYGFYAARLPTDIT